MIIFTNTKIIPVQAINSGFTLIELLLVIGLTVILAAASFPIYSNMQLHTNISESSIKVQRVLMEARESARNGRDDANYGVYFNLHSDPPYKFIFYQGDSFAARNESADQVFQLDSSTIVAATSWPDNDINFSRSTGFPAVPGSIFLSQFEQAPRTININEIGIIDEQM